MLKLHANGQKILPQAQVYFGFISLIDDSNSSLKDRHHIQIWHGLYNFIAILYGETRNNLKQQLEIALCVAQSDDSCSIEENVCMLRQAEEAVDIRKVWMEKMNRSVAFGFGPSSCASRLIKTEQISAGHIPRASPCGLELTNCCSEALHEFSYNCQLPLQFWMLQKTLEVG